MAMFILSGCNGLLYMVNYLKQSLKFIGIYFLPFTEPAALKILWNIVPVIYSDNYLWQMKQLLLANETITSGKWESYFWQMKQLLLANETVTSGKWNSYFWQMKQLLLANETVTSGKWNNYFWQMKPLLLANETITCRKWDNYFWQLRRRLLENEKNLTIKHLIYNVGRRVKKICPMQTMIKSSPFRFLSVGHFIFAHQKNVFTVCEFIHNFFYSK